MTRNQLLGTGIALLLCAHLALFLHFAERRAQRREREALSSRLDSINIRVDYAFGELDAELNAERNAGVPLAELEDVGAELTGFKTSMDAPTSVSNLWSFVYAGFMIAGSGAILAASRLPRNSHTQNGG